MSGEDVRTLVLQIISENYLGPKFWSTTVKLIHDGGGGGAVRTHKTLLYSPLWYHTHSTTDIKYTIHSPPLHTNSEGLTPRMKHHFIYDASYKYKQFQNDWYVWIPKAKYREFEARHLSTPHFPYNTIRNR